MGPRLINRGEEILKENQMLETNPSMGPRLINRGEVAPIVHSVDFITLQWGRGL